MSRSDSRSVGRSRRAFLTEGLLRIGALGIGTSAIAGSSGAAEDETFGRRDRSVIFLMLQGGPSHIDLWDPKPTAGIDVRGPFASIPTRVPGVAFGELMERTAGISDRIAVIRSMTHPFTNHIAGTYVALTGSHDQRDQDREAHGDDFPGPGAILQHLAPNSGPVPVSVSLPNWLSIPGPSNRMPGQYGGFLGGVCDPFLLEGDPAAERFDPLGLNGGAGLPIERLSDRRSLLGSLDRAARWLDAEREREGNRFAASAYELLSDGSFRRALDLSEEPSAIRDRYGRNRVGQSFLLARRLAEAGVRWISFNEFNQKWDTHGDLLPRYRQIVPEIDRAWAALVEDLASRGMLDRTMLMLGGEFGRTPRINDLAGRDHWPNAYSILMAGGGIRGGTVLGETDRQGAEVLSGRVLPADVLATLWQHLGIPPRAEMRDRLDRPFPVSQGRVLDELLGGTT